MFRAATVAALFSLLTCGPAAAHEETALHALSVIESVEPQIDGLSFRVVQLTQPVLFARNHTSKPLIVYGERGEPFLRLHDGRVETNLNSALTYTTRDPMGTHSAGPTDLNPGGPARWEVLAHRMSWSWFDPRIRWAPSRNTWQVLARLGRRDIVLTGGFESLLGHGHFDTTIEDPGFDDLEMRLMDGLVPAFYVRNDSRKTLRVTGSHGEPFLKIGPRGVLANTRSPDYYMGGNQTVRAVPASADPHKAPRWERLSEIPIWSWLEFRARLPARAHERARLGDQRKTVLEWTTPMSFGGEPLPIHGAVMWVPPHVQPTIPPKTNTTMWVAGLVAVAIGAAAALLAWRQRAALISR